MAILILSVVAWGTIYAHDILLFIFFESCKLAGYLRETYLISVMSSMQSQLSSLEYSVSHSTQAVPYTHARRYRLLFAKRHRWGSWDGMLSVQTYSGPPLFLEWHSVRVWLGRMARHNQIRNDCWRWESNLDLLTTSRNPLPLDHSWLLC